MRPLTVYTVVMDATMTASCPDEYGTMYAVVGIPSRTTGRVPASLASSICGFASYSWIAPVYALRQVCAIVLPAAYALMVRSGLTRLPCPGAHEPRSVML